MSEPLRELKHLVSTTKENYKLLYLDLLQQAQKWLQSQQRQALFDANLALAIAVLKHRRAYMLPIGANAETCYQQQDVWTYALFTAALLRNSGFENTAKQFETMLPDKGLLWIKRFDVLFKQWMDFLNDKPQTDNTIAAIIQKAEAVLLHKPVATDADKENRVDLLYPTAKTFEVNPEQTDAPKKEEPLSSEPENKKIETNNISDKQIAAQEPEPASTPSKTTIINQFIVWLKQALTDKKIAINFFTDDDHGAVHHVGEGILLVMPDSWDLFLAEHPEAPDDWQVLINDEYTFIKTANQNFIHIYYAGDWRSRRVLKGLLIKPTKLFSLDSLPPINKLLALDHTSFN